MMNPKNLIAVGDVHGMAQTLELLLNEADRHESGMHRRAGEWGPKFIVGSRSPRPFVQPPSKAHCPAFDYPPRKASCQVRMMGCVAAVAKSDKI